MHGINILVVSLCDIRRRDVVGEYGVGQRKLKARMLLVLPGDRIMCQIRGLRGRKVIVGVGQNEAEIDIGLVRK